MPKAARTTVAKRLGPCRRCCVRPRPAVTVERLSFGDSTYELELCDDHADMFRTGMYAWTRVGTLVDDDVNVSFKAAAPVAQTRNLGRLVVSHLHIPEAAAAQPEPVAVPAPRPESRRPESRFVGLPFDAARWTWSNHAMERATLRQLTETEVLWCAERPDVTRAARQPGCRVHLRGHIKAVINPQTHEILTVADTRYEDDEERELENAS